MKTKNRQKRGLLHLFLPALLLSVFIAKAQEVTTASMLKEFVESYKNDPMAHSVEFGVKVGDEWYNVKSVRKQEAYKAGKKKQYTLHHYGPHLVVLRNGKPDTPTWYFEFEDRTVLENIYSGKWTAATASAKSTGADKVGLNIRSMEGFQSGTKEEAIGYEVMEHFWKKAPVEITYFTRDQSLPTHGADHVGLYTMKDKRIGWFSIGPEQAANADRGLDKGQVPNMIIITKGKGKAELGDEVVELKPGMSIFVPPYVKHVFYNPYDEPMEGIVILFGDNSDFIFGKSYMDMLEEQHRFYENYEMSASH